MLDLSKDLVNILFLPRNNASLAYCAHHDHFTMQQKKKKKKNEKKKEKGREGKGREGVKL